jgi:DNA-binding XRE family transcriptional regulator
MGRQKLTIAQVKRIKRLLMEGDYTHQEIGKKFKVSRETISKIHIGMIDPMNKNARWGDIVIEE